MSRCKHLQFASLGVKDKIIVGVLILFPHVLQKQSARLRGVCDYITN